MSSHQILVAQRLNPRYYHRFSRNIKISMPVREPLASISFSQLKVRTRIVGTINIRVQSIQRRH
jgi:hypothetical protein